MRFRDLNLKLKVLIPSMGGILIVSALIAQFYIRDITAQAEAAILEKSRAIVSTVEAARDVMADRIQSGVVTDLQALAKKGDMATLMKAVPIITAIEIASKNAKEGDYSFRVPKFQPRNPDNEPKGVEIDALKKLESGQVKEIVLRQDGEIHYFRPIVLSEDCMLCHGDPAGSPDPTGGAKEGWKVGEVHGAFEISSSLEEAARTQAAATSKIVGSAIALMLGLGFGLFFVIRIVLKPISSYIHAFQGAASGDLTVRAMARGQDEIGRMAEHLNGFLSPASGDDDRGKIGRGPGRGCLLGARLELRGDGREPQRGHRQHRGHEGQDPACSTRRSRAA